MPAEGGSSRPAATARLSVVRWWHSWCRVRSLGLRTSRPSARYTAQLPVGRTTGRDWCGKGSPVVRRAEPAEAVTSDTDPECLRADLGLVGLRDYSVATAPVRLGTSSTQVLPGAKVTWSPSDPVRVTG